MNYVVYDRATHQMLFKNKIFRTLRGAKIALTRYCNTNGKNVDDYCASDYESYDKSVPMVERVNIMSGEKYWEKANTPPVSFARM